MIGILPTTDADWRCHSCPVQPRLGIIVDGGKIQVRASATRGTPLYVEIDLIDGAVRAHCPACHAWREYRYDRQTGTFSESAAAGRIPGIRCRCSEPNFIPRFQRNGHDA